MANTVRFEVYSVILEPRKGRTAEGGKYPVGLSSISNEELMRFFRTFFDSLKVLSNDKVSLKALQLVSDSLKASTSQRRIAGVIESGSYGLAGILRNVTKKVADKKRLKDEADMMPFYFLLYYNDTTENGILITQRTGGHGIHTAFKIQLLKYLRENLPNYTPKLANYISPQLLDEFANKSQINQISLTSYKLPDSVIEKLGVDTFAEDFMSMELVIKSRKGGFRKISGDKIRESAFYTAEELTELGFNKDSITIKSTFGKTTRTVDISDTGKMRPYYEPSDDIEIDSETGHPTFDSIHKEGKKLLGEIYAEMYAIE